MFHKLDRTDKTCVSTNQNQHYIIIQLHNFAEMKKPK